MRKTRYNHRKWLNSIDSDSTGSIVAFDGTIESIDNEILDWAFLEISDCRVKVRLHMTKDDSKQEFINKLSIMRDEIDSFITHLETYK